MGKNKAKKRMKKSQRPNGKSKDGQAQSKTKRDIHTYTSKELLKTLRIVLPKVVKYSIFWIPVIDEFCKHHL